MPPNVVETFYTIQCHCGVRSRGRCRDLEHAVALLVCLGWQQTGADTCVCPSCRVDPGQGGSP